MLEISDSIENLCRTMVNMTAQQFSDPSIAELEKLSKRDRQTVSDLRETEINEARDEVFEIAHVVRLQVGRAQILGYPLLAQVIDALLRYVGDRCRAVHDLYEGEGHSLGDTAHAELAEFRSAVISIIAMHMEQLEQRQKGFMRKAIQRVKEWWT
jgi:hypothetical protein